MQTHQPASIPSRHGLLRFTLAWFLAFLLATTPSAEAKALFTFSSSQAIPSPRGQSCDVLFEGRTARPDPEGTIDICRLDAPTVVPDTYSNGLIGQTDGFDWYVSAHFALKTDLDDREAAQALVLLETAWPLYESLFGAAPWRCGDGPRIAIVLASSREALGGAIVSDDMHVFHLGGITQEGFAAAYLYASSPYQTRYILLHEVTHLFQYCLNGNTRGCYGFFVEGIADFFSSHVYDSATGRLTVNVLDRAPIHNHLEAGLETWHELGEPSFSSLYEKGDICRGVNVLLTAFLQSTPEYERHWARYVRGVVANRTADRAKAVSDDLMETLYGGTDALDGPFASWTGGLRPSYRLETRDFDQDGDTLVSGEPASLEAPAVLLLPGLSAKPGLFVRDWPSSGRAGATSATTIFRVTIRSREALPPNDYAEISLRDPTGTPLLACRILSLPSEAPRPGTDSDGDPALETVALPPASWERGVTIEFSRSSDPAKPIDLFVTTPDALLLLASPALPRKVAKRLADLGEIRPGLTASAPGLRFTPENGSSGKAPRLTDLPPGTPSRQMALGRFKTTTAYSRIELAIGRLGQDAPLPLRLARNDLAAQLRGEEALLVTSEVLETAGYWKSIAKAIAGSRASADAKNQALLDLSGLRLVCGPTADGPAATLSAPPPYPDEVRFDWSDGFGRETTTLPAGGAKTTAPCPAPLSEGSYLTVRATVRWLGQEIVLSRESQLRGAIPTWHLLGPFRIPGNVFTNASFLDETEPVDTIKTHPRDDGSRLAWQTCRRPDDLNRAASKTTSIPYDRALWKATGFLPPRETLPPVLHLTRLFFRQANNSVAYAAIRVTSPADHKAILSLGATDGVSVWHDGIRIHEEIRPREWSEGNVRVPIRLKKGSNEILLKLIHHENVWFLSGSLLDEAGVPIPGLVYR